MDYTEVMSKPARKRIMKYLAVNVEATTKEIAEYLTDIPRRTLYRHINFLIEGKAILVKEERKVRGGTERLLVDNQKGFVSGLGLSDATYQYLMDIYNKFCIYEKKHGENTGEDFNKDLLAFGTSTFYLDDSEMKSMLDEIYEIGIKYERQHKEKYGSMEAGKLRSCSFISAPVDMDMV